MNKKRNIIILLGVIIVVGLIIILNIDFKDNNSTENGWSNPVKIEKTIDDLLIEKGNKFYENYYNGINNPNSLSSFSEVGINVSLEQIDMVVTLDDNIKQLLNNKMCDYKKSKLVFYPEVPFGIKNYKIKVELNCQK